MELAAERLVLVAAVQLVRMCRAVSTEEEPDHDITLTGMTRPFNLEVCNNKRSMFTLCINISSLEGSLMEARKKPEGERGKGGLRKQDKRQWG